MKTNKLAAGALALALGLGAVTPAFAADTTKTGNEKKGEVLITQEYRDAETVFVKAFKSLQDAKAKEAEAKKVRDAKEAAHEAAKDALDKHDEETENIERRLASVDEEGSRIYEQLLGNGGSTSAKGWMDVTRDNYTPASQNEASQNAQQASIEDLLAKQAKYREVAQELVGRETTRRNLQIAIDRAAEELDIAETNYQNAVLATAAAKTEYDSAKIAFLAAGANRKAIGEAEKYGDLKYITVDPAEKESESSESKDDVLAKAEKAYEDARVTVKAVELIKVTAPKVYEKNKVAIDAYLEKANAAVNKLGKALGKKVAVSDLLFSTAYADEEASLEEIKDLTKEVEDVDKEGKELLENINKQEEEADKKDEKEADKKDEKEADKKDEKEADKKDEKEADKKDEKTEDKKDEKAPAAKKASSNAKTGVAGVTGVAGILAAASVAYAASKKRD